MIILRQTLAVGLLAAALPLVETLFRPHKPLQKAGVLLQQLQSDSQLQPHLLAPLDPAEQQRRQALMAVIDGLNRRYGSTTVQWAACGLAPRWMMRRSRLSGAATTRIGELREVRIRGLQTIDEFMTRRLSPAMATCATANQRLHDLSERVAQASNLLSTRVDIARERQNQALLAATARRAKLQLRLQQTVEGLSVAAISYYLVGLCKYLAESAKALGLIDSSALATGIAVPLCVGLVWYGTRRLKRSLHLHESKTPQP